MDLALFLLIAIFTMWGIGSYGLYEPHEAQYGGGATEMVQRGDWVTPYINGDREVNKPPLFYWLIAVSYTLFSKVGLTPEFVLRLPLAMICLSGSILAGNGLAKSGAFEPGASPHSCSPRCPAGTFSPTNS